MNHVYDIHDYMTLMHMKLSVYIGINLFALK